MSVSSGFRVRVLKSRPDFYCTSIVSRMWHFEFAHPVTQWARKFKKVQAKKNSWNQINQENIFVKLHFWQFQTFPQFKNWFLTFFEIAKKMEFGQKIFSWNWFIGFHEFFFCLHFFFIFWPIVSVHHPLFSQNFFKSITFNIWPRLILIWWMSSYILHSNQFQGLYLTKSSGETLHFRIFHILLYVETPKMLFLLFISC